MFTLMTLLVIVIALLGGWALLFSPYFFNTRQTSPSVVFVSRVIFIVALVLLNLILIGAIPNKGL